MGEKVIAALNARGLTGSFNYGMNSQRVVIQGNGGIPGNWIAAGREAGGIYLELSAPVINDGMIAAVIGIADQAMAERVEVVNG